MAHAALLAAVAGVVVVAAYKPPPLPQVDTSWQADFGGWRQRQPVSLKQWADGWPVPVNASVANPGWDAAATNADKVPLQQACLAQQAKEFADHVYTYKSPRLADVRSRVLQELRRRGLSVTVAVFWGRYRYVRLLLPFLVRNLDVNHGIVNRVVLLHHNRDVDAAETAKLTAAVTAAYPHHFVEMPFCSHPFACAYSESLVDDATVYVKLDDDIVFIKDGSVEHLVLQQLTNDDFAFYSGAVVNNPHSYGVHAMAGAYPLTLYHAQDMQTSLRPPFIQPEGQAEDATAAYRWYWGPNLSTAAGIRAHEAFVYNAAHGLLHMYAFDLWDMHRCRCAVPQKGLDLCSFDGLYRWSINAVAFARNNTVHRHPMAHMRGFDEPMVSLAWVHRSDQRRVAIVGESLFVHVQYTKQRTAKWPSGLREDVLLPWYHEFTRQYLAQPYGQWQGNVSLLAEYHRRAYIHGEDPFNVRHERPHRPPDTTDFPDIGFAF